MNTSGARSSIDHHVYRGNKETIRQLAYLKVSKNCLEEIAQRPRDLNYVYKLENPKVSLKSLAVQKTEDMLGVNMMIRVRGNQVWFNRIFLNWG